MSAVEDLMNRIGVTARLVNEQSEFTSLNDKGITDALKTIEVNQMQIMVALVEVLGSNVEMPQVPEIQPEVAPEGGPEGE